MKIRFLIQGKKNSDKTYDFVWQGQFFKNLSVGAETFYEGVEAMRFVLEQFMKTRGMDWIEKWKGNSGCVNCPEAYIELPCDIWKCRISKETCRIQAQVPTNDKDKFSAGCDAPEERKENIFKTIKDGKYTGFHHVPGRYLCVQCQSDKWKKRNEHYHYPWELVSVSDCVDFSDEFKPEESEPEEILDYKESPTPDEKLKDRGYLTLEEMLKEEGFEPWAAGYGVCPKCCERIISAIFPEINNQIQVVELDFYDR